MWSVGIVGFQSNGFEVTLPSTLISNSTASISPIIFLNLPDGMAFQLSGMLLYLALLARYLSARRYRQRGYPLTADRAVLLLGSARLRCLSQLRSDRMTFRCSLFASPRLFRCDSNSVKCTTRFPAILMYRTDCFFQPTKALFVAGIYDLLKNLG